MMESYRFHGHDSSSDNGYWEVVIAAINRPQADRLLREHFQTSFPNRMGLIKDADVGSSPLVTPGVLHSTVEA